MVRETNAECHKVYTKLLSSTFRPSLLKFGPIYYLTWFVTTPVNTVSVSQPLNEICELHNSIINIKKTVYFVRIFSFLKYIILFTVIWHQQWPNIIWQWFFVIFSCNDASTGWTSWFAKVSGKFWELRELFLVKLLLPLEVTIASLTWVWRSMAVFKSITDLINGCVLGKSGTVFSCRDKKNEEQTRNMYVICIY